MYINGVLEGESNIGALTYNSNTSLWIGSECSTSFYQGYLDDMKIWNTAIDISNIDNNSSNLVGHWDFNEGDGNIINDLSDNGNLGKVLILL